MVLKLEGTKYATPVDGDKLEFPVAAHLGYGNSKTRDVEFKALGRISFSDFLGSDLQEPYVHARVEGEFDIVRFFHIVQEATFSTQIEEG